MKYKINMSRGEQLSADEEMVEFIASTPNQVITFRDDNNRIEKIVNKAHIVSIVPDREAEEGLVDESRMLPERKPNVSKVVEVLDKIREEQPWAKRPEHIDE